METIKYMAIYLDDSCEVHFTDDNSKIVLSPCGTEFMYNTYFDDVMRSGSFKYRTAYAISKFSAKLSVLLKERNRFCERPFVSPSIIESKNDFWISSENLNEFKWQTSEFEKSVIERDYHNFWFIWKSVCKKAQLKLHFNKSILVVKYPIKIPINENDEFDLKYDITNTSKTYLSCTQSINTTVKIKNIFKYTYNEQEYSTRHLPTKFQQIYSKMIELVGNIDNQLTNSVNDDAKTEFSIKFDETLPLTCEATHLHRFENMEMLNEPKVIYSNQTWYKLFYKDNKTIEISCMSNNNVNCMDYLISDTPTGRYYTCYSLNERSGEIDDLKICVDNVPSFKMNLKTIVNYSNILLKRLVNLNFVSKYQSCLKRNETNSELLDESVIKKQHVVHDVGHFMLFNNNTIQIRFLDRIKLFVDSEAIDMYKNQDYTKCFCTITLPDLSQHEVNFALTDTCNNCFSKYVDFLNQWLKWLYQDEVKCEDTSKNENLDLNSIQSHISQLKFFNFSINQDLTEYPPFAASSDTSTNNGNTNSQSIYDPLNLNTISNLLKENSEFLKSISKN